MSRGFKPTEESWQRFVEATAGQPPWPRLVAASQMFQRPGDALDVGAGAGRDSKYLLEHGWRVTSVDASEHSVAALRRLASLGDLQVVQSAAQDFTPGDYDLVNAQYSLPFIPPALFRATVQRLQDAVRRGGIMARHLLRASRRVEHAWNRDHFSHQARCRGPVRGVGREGPR